MENITLWSKGLKSSTIGVQKNKKIKKIPVYKPTNYTIGIFPSNIKTAPPPHTHTRKRNSSTHNSNIASVAQKVTVLQAISQAGTRDQNDILMASLPADGMMPLAKDAVVSVTCCGAPDSCNMFSRDRLLPSDDTHSDIMLQNSNNSKILQINFVQPKHENSYLWWLSMHVKSSHMFL